MKAAIFGEGKLEIRDTPAPSPGFEEALIKISTAGVCHSDLHFIRGDWPRFSVPFPVPLGHEGIGVVDEVGPGADKYISKGDRVIVGLGGAGGYWCGACEQCLSGRTRLCKETRVIVGTYAEYVSLWAKTLVRLPEQVGDNDVPLACAGLTAYAAVKKLLKYGVIPGKPVAIIGAAGGLGHYAVQVAKVFGYKVVGIDVGKAKTDFVRSLGADHAVDAGEAAEFVRDTVGGVYASIVFSHKLAGFELGMKIMRRAALFVSVGMPPSSDGPLAVSPLTILTRDIMIVPSAVGTVEEMRELVQLAAEGRVKTHIDRSAKLSELSQVLDDLEKGAYTGRAIITNMAE